MSVLRNQLVAPLWPLLLSMFLTSVGLAGPRDVEGYRIQQGGPVSLPPGSFVQGSVLAGGLQPDYHLSPDDPVLNRFLESVATTVARDSMIARLEHLGDEEATVRKIDLVTQMVREALPHGDYDEPRYLKLLAEHRSRGDNVKVGGYLSCGAGVCRENGLVTHLALQRVGVCNQYVYAKVRQFDAAEDHAFAVVAVDGQRWIVDPYNFNFHGQNFDDLIAREKDGRTRVRRSSFAESDVDEIGIREVLSYPVYWIPK